MTKYQKFRELHQQENPLQIGNVWDCQSALMFEKLGYKAVGTSSAAIAHSLGYEDGEQMSFEELNAIVKLIVSKITIPLTVDMEGGYSRNVEQIINNIIMIYHAGAVGINLEDSVVSEGRKILDPYEFGETIRAVKLFLKKKNIDIFLNLRIDPYLMGLNEPLDKTISRIRIYEESGADGVFVPCITNETDITKVVESTSLPVNVMAMPNLPKFEVLKRCGIKRMSMGSFLYSKMEKNLENDIASIDKNKDFSRLFLQ